MLAIDPVPHLFPTQDTQTWNWNEQLFFAEISPPIVFEKHLRKCLGAGCFDNMFQTYSSAANDCMFLPCGVHEAMSWATAVLHGLATAPLLNLVHSARGIFSFGWQEKDGNLSEQAGYGRDLAVDNPPRLALFLKGYYIFRRPGDLSDSGTPVTVRADAASSSQNNSTQAQPSSRTPPGTQPQSSSHTTASAGGHWTRKPSQVSMIFRFLALF